MAYPSSPVKHDRHVEDEIMYECRTPGYWAKAGYDRGGMWNLFEQDIAKAQIAETFTFPGNMTRYATFEATTTPDGTANVYFYLRDRAGGPHAISAGNVPEMPMWLNWGGRGHQVGHAIRAWNTTYQYGFPINRTDDANWRPRGGNFIYFKLRLMNHHDSVAMHFRTVYITQDNSDMYVVGMARQTNLQLDQVGGISMYAPTSQLGFTAYSLRYF